QGDVASQLNLQIHIVEELEANDIDSLPASTYVRGYIRSYARIVNLDADALIDLYDNDAKAPPEILPDVKHHGQASSSDKPVKAATYLIIFGLVLLLLAWWQSHFIVGEKNLFSDSKDYGGDLSYTYEIVIHPDTPFLEKTTQDENSITQLPLYEPVPDSPIETLALPGPLSIDTTLDSAISQIKNTGTGPDHLSFNVIENSWIEVRDANNNIIFQDLTIPGDKINLRGTAPFSVIVGFSPGVRAVVFNGKSYDVGSHSDKGISRFTLGE
ncbi:MAG: RodZ domain-containing protein, partial [Gammaproteobacteria bacterium]